MRRVSRLARWLRASTLDEKRDPGASKGVELRDLRASSLDKERDPGTSKGVELRDLRASALDEEHGPGASKGVERRDLRASLDEERDSAAFKGVELREFAFFISSLMSLVSFSSSSGNNVGSSSRLFARFLAWFLFLLVEPLS